MNKKTTGRATVVALVSLLFALAVDAQTLSQQAAARIQRGDFAGAEAVYDSMLRANPADREARLGRGHVRSWQHKFEAAGEDFHAVLAADPANLSALNGLGYNHAWAGEYAQAEQYFRRALEVAPDSREAAKGLAFVALWRGDAGEAVRRFEAVVARTPDDAEARVGLGQAYLAAGRKSPARDAFRQAQKIDPRRADAREGVEATRYREPVVQLSLWGGHSEFESGGSETGVRFGEFAVLPTRNTRLWFQYDNGLTLDNRSLALSNLDVPTYFVGGYVHWQRRYTTRLEFGWRELPGDIGQKIVRAEQVFFLPRNYTFKFGGWSGPREDDRTEWGIHSAVGVPVGERCRLEPTFFYSRTGLPGEDEWRLMLAGEYSLPRSWRVGAGIAGGRQSRLLTGSDAIWDGYARLTIPIGQWTGAHLMYRRAVSGPNSGFHLFAFGFTVSIPGR